MKVDTAPKTTVLNKGLKELTAILLNTVLTDYQGIFQYETETPIYVENELKTFN